MATRIEVNRALARTLRRALRAFPEITPFVIRAAHRGRRAAPPPQKEAFKAAIQEMYRNATDGDPIGDHRFVHWNGDVLNHLASEGGETDPDRDGAAFEGEAGIEPSSGNDI